jgi:hypothetical protein
VTALAEIYPVIRIARPMFSAQAMNLDGYTPEALWAPLRNRYLLSDALMQGLSARIVSLKAGMLISSGRSRKLRMALLERHEKREEIGGQP